jgi:S1-C subfamily serine protease
MRRRALLLALALLPAAVVPAQETDTPRRASAKLPSRPKNPLLAPKILKDFFRPTVTIRQANGRGSGTMVATAPGSTLILTAAHVVAGDGPLEIELHPYNFGIEKNERAQGGTTWPRLVPADRIAADDAADVALVRMHDRAAVPFVARLDLDAKEPGPADILTSIGVVSGKDLTGWRTDIQGQARIDLTSFIHRGKPGDARIFTVTTKPPEFGRSGGGLFRPDGSLVGIAVGRLRINDAPEIGVFASMESIRKLVRENRLEATLSGR